jgi:hypothetical protein
MADGGGITELTCVTVGIMGQCRCFRSHLPLTGGIIAKAKAEGERGQTVANPSRGSSQVAIVVLLTGNGGGGGGDGGGGEGGKEYGNEDGRK